MFPVIADINIKVSEIEYRRILITPNSSKPSIAEPYKLWMMTLALICILMNEMNATSIVVIRMPDMIAFAADSGGTFEGGGKPTNLQPVCKIYKSGNLFFAVGAFVNDPLSKISVPDIVTSTPLSADIRTRAKSVESKLRAIASREMASIKKNDPSKYKTIVSGKVDFSEVIFFGLEKGELVVTGFGLKVVKKGERLNPTAKWISCPGDCPTGTQLFYLGQHDDIDSYVKSDKPLPRVIWDAAKFLVNIEIVAKPNEVSAPIHLFVVDKNGARWLTHYPECPDSVRAY